VSDELERRSREWTAMVRLLEQNRHTLDCAEMERDAAYDELARIVPIVQETAKELTAAMDASRSGRPSPDLPELFAKNSESLDQLEKVSVALSGHFLRCRAAWEQYARSVENAVVSENEADSEAPVALESIARPQTPMNDLQVGRMVTVDAHLVAGDFTVLTGRSNTRSG